jgi:predicted amidohydrolase YtcJ
MRRERLVSGHLLFAAVALALLLLFAATRSGPSVTPPASAATAAGTSSAPAQVFVGEILTMKQRRSERVVEAVSVDARGVILKVGDADEILATAGPQTQVVRLRRDETLMPGFVDPHLHLVPTIQQELPDAVNVEPCMPRQFRAIQTPGCPKTIEDALTLLREQAAAQPEGFIYATGLDPSRQPLDATTSSKAFNENPAQIIAEQVSATRPVFMVNASGHEAYVNQAAFALAEDVLRAQGQPVPPTFTQGGKWVTDPDTGQYTGLILEDTAFGPFIEAMTVVGPPSLRSVAEANQITSLNPQQVTEGVAKLVDQGITTVVDGGQLSYAQTQGAQAIASLPDSPIRVLSGLVYSNLLRDSLTPVPPSCDPTSDPTCRLPTDLGLSTVKLWVDGSLQGCTAFFAPPSGYLDRGTCKGTHRKGRSNYTAQTDVTDALRPLWDQGIWRFNVHALGNRGIKWAIESIAELQSEFRNPFPVLLIHSALPTEKIIRQISQLREGDYVMRNGETAPAVDISVSHTVSQTPLLGGVYREIFGRKTASLLNPTGLEHRYGIPWSLHSDSPVTPSAPIFFVEQAVTRRAWIYPQLKDADSFILGGNTKASVYRALRGVTTVGAHQHGLGPWLGTLAPGKVADFVRLSDNPLDYARANGGRPNQIHTIDVVTTYLGGVATD